MKNSQLRENFVSQGMTHRFKVLGIPSYIFRPMVEDILRWKTCSGTEWTIKRLKSLKSDLFRNKAGLPLQTWIRKNRNGKLFGWYGSLFNFAKRSKKTFRAAVQALCCYTYFTANSLTPSQEKKFVEAVNSKPVFLPPNLIQDIQRVTLEQIGERFIKLKTFPTLVTYQGSPSKKAPIFKDKSVFQNSHLERDLYWFDDPSNLSFYDRFRRVYSPVLLGLEKFRRLESSLCYKYTKKPSISPTGWENVACGEIHFLQEPGFKCRSIASPYRLHQLAMKPLGDILYTILGELPWDCTFHQDKAITYVQKHLLSGKVVHSIDLSSFTDLFPLQLQICVLETIFGKDNPYIGAFEALSRGRWFSSIGEIRWTKGQPLGLYPSFALAGITHGLLLATLAGPYRNQFFVLGDDVIILDDHLHKSYIQTLDLLKCPWSPDKTFSSNIIGEFAGQIITSDSVIPQFKWREIDDENFIDICRNLGHSSRSLLSRDQKIIFDAIKNYLPPFGLGFSQPGDNLSKAVERTELFLARFEKKRVGSLVDLMSDLDRKFEFSDESLYRYIDFNGLSKILSTFDEKVRRAFANTVFGKLVDRCVAFSKGIHDILEKDNIRTLPTPVYSPSHLTQLDRYRDILELAVPAL